MDLATEHLQVELTNGISLLVLARNFGALLAVFVALGMLANSRSGKVKGTEQSLIQRAYHVKMTDEQQVNQLFSMVSQNELRDISSLKSTVYKQFIMRQRLPRLQLCGSDARVERIFKKAFTKLHDDLDILQHVKNTQRIKALEQILLSD
jgi:hypothetical protein